MEFSRYLRRQGTRISPAQLLDGLRAAQLVGVHSPEDLHHALRGAFSGGRQDFIRFPSHFHRFFYDQAGDRADSGRPLSTQSVVDETLGLGLGQVGGEEGIDPGSAHGLTSRVEVLGRTGFGRLDPAQARLMALEAAALLEPLARRLARRRKKKGPQLDWSATLRRSMRSGGELVRLVRRRRQKRQRRLVILADVSGSMDLAAPFVFHFLRGLGEAWRQVEVFVFATRLTRVTPWLFSGHGDRFMERCRRRVPDLAGGTRLGEALGALSRGYGRMIGPSSVALIFSDGWDRGDPVALAREMARLKRRCHRVVWLNPLLESPRYRPVNLGMAAALPYVDHFLACHNLVSLRKVADVLERLVK